MKFMKLGFFLSTVFAAGAVAIAPAAVAQSPTAPENSNSEASLANGTAINAVLDTSIDSKKAKSGETVLAHTTETMKSTDNRAIMPKGTKLMGHITQASSRASGGSDSMVAIQFDKAVLKDGQEVPLANFTIQALAAPSSAPSFADSDRLGGPSNGPVNNAPSNNPSMSGSRGARPDANPGTGTQSYPNAEPNGAPASEPTAAGPLPANARGVYGLDGVRLGSNTQGSVIESNGKNLHVDKGARLLLVGQPHGGAAAAGR